MAGFLSSCAARFSPFTDWAARKFGTQALAEGDVAPEKSYSGELGVGPLIWTGSLIVLAFFGVLGGWAGLAPIQSAAIAQGVVSVDTNRKTIQHLEGGIVGAIHVRDGDIVSKGQVLVTLDKTKAEATLDI